MKVLSCGVKKSCMLISAIILSLLVIAGLPGEAEEAWAMGSSNPKVNLYFHGNSLAHKLNVNYYGLLTIKYDGVTIVSNKKITRNTGFGGVTSDSVRKRASVEVKIKIYNNNDTKLGEKSWEDDLHDGDNRHYWYAPNAYCAFEMNLKRSGNDVAVSFN